MSLSFSSTSECLTDECRSNPPKLSLSYSTLSDCLTDECRTNDGEDPKTVASDNSTKSNKVSVEQIFPEDYYESECLLPESMKNLEPSALKGQCCTAKLYSVDLTRQVYNETAEVELSAFLNDIDTKGNNIVELCCDQKGNTDKSYFHLEFEDQIRKVQLLPLPLSTKFQRVSAFTSYRGSQTCGVLLLVVSKSTGMSLHSIILSRKSSFDPFHISEFAKVSRGKVEDTGPCVEISYFLDNTRDEMGRNFGLPDPVLYCAILPCRPSFRSHRIDVLACPLIGHKSPLFHFKNRGPTRALRRSMVLTGVGDAMGISISARRLGMQSFCTFAALFESEMKVICLPSLDQWSKQPLKPDDIFTVPLHGPTKTSPFALVSLSGTWAANTKLPVSFAILSSLKPGSLDVAQEQKSPQLSPWAIASSPRANVPHRVCPPPQWTSRETRNAVLRARRNIMANVINTLHGEGSSRASDPLDPSDDTVLVTPKGKGTLSPKGSPSTVLDEDFDVSIPSPDTAVLDMSDASMQRIPSDSCLSALVGLNLSGNDDSSAKSSKAGERPYWTPNNTTSGVSANNHRLAPSIRLLIVSLPGKWNLETITSIKTHVHDLPQELQISLDAVSMKPSQSELLLALKPSASFDVRVLQIPLARGLPSISADEWDTRICPVPIRRSHFDGKVKALDFDSGVDGSIQLRVVTARNADIALEPVGLDALVGHIVNIEMATITGLSTVESATDATDSSDQSTAVDSVVTEKLDLIMKTLLRFEANVNQRLNRMEKRMKENADRLARLEDDVSSRVEI